ncbi:hypothetical protein CKO28_08795 [Rhodovibrio sodomensis]|uniref:TMEM205-like domain-containing protein n=1 Tax=Rhodovibrio sodomensis TaxID=1088 RepID=A0ABS1DDD4_9PROT|nr:DUF4149 domain-containing protein [Rhodovibrio sodomensis]MBK1668132.1 hypothetical protein [Rhodovibrio sodomensis]
MTDYLSLSLLAALAAALLVGSMLFFAAMVAPMVFKVLDAVTAGRFIRRLFPVYYLGMFAFAATAAAAAALVRPVDAVVLALVALGFLYARQVLMPRINALRDRELAGESAAGKRFERLHGLSVWINGAQFLAATVVLARLIVAA